MPAVVLHFNAYVLSVGGGDSTLRSSGLLKSFLNVEGQSITATVTEFVQTEIVKSFRMLHALKARQRNSARTGCKIHPFRIELATFSVLG